MNQNNLIYSYPYINYKIIEKLDDNNTVFINIIFLYYVLSYYEVLKNKELFDEVNILLRNFEKKVKNNNTRFFKVPISTLKKIFNNFPNELFQRNSFKIETNELTKKIAYGLLTNNKDLTKKENRWILHCINVGNAAGKIAEKLNLNKDYATILGYIHDIGRTIDHNNHPIEGFIYLTNLGYYKEARVCLTHSFIDNNITLTAGGGPKTQENYSFINDFLKNTSVSIYDNIVQLCDLFSTEYGFTTIEKRLLDISNRKGIFTNSKLHYLKALELKERIEKELKCSLYSLFPEININDLNNIENDREKLLNLLEFDENTKSK